MSRKLRLFSRLSAPRNRPLFRHAALPTFPHGFQEHGGLISFFPKDALSLFSLPLPEPTGNAAKNNTKKFHFFHGTRSVFPSLSARRGSGEKKAALPHEKAAFADDAENYSSPILRAMLWAARRPAPMARMTVAAPVTMSPPAYTLGMEVSPFSSTAM